MTTSLTNLRRDAVQCPLSKKIFERLDIPNLIINICDYKDPRNDPILAQYQEWCIDILRQSWHDSDQWVDGAFHPFDVFLKELLNGEHDAFMRHISTATKDDIYLIVNKIFK